MKLLLSLLLATPLVQASHQAPTPSQAVATATSASADAAAAQDENVDIPMTAAHAAPAPAPSVPAQAVRLAADGSRKRPAQDVKEQAAQQEEDAAPAAKKPRSESSSSSSASVSSASATASATVPVAQEAAVDVTMAVSDYRNGHASSSSSSSSASHIEQKSRAADQKAQAAVQQASCLSPQQQELNRIIDDLSREYLGRIPHGQRILSEDELRTAVIFAQSPVEAMKLEPSYARLTHNRLCPRIFAAAERAGALSGKPGVGIAEVVTAMLRMPSMILPIADNKYTAKVNELYSNSHFNLMISRALPESLHEYWAEWGFYLGKNGSPMCANCQDPHKSAEPNQLQILGDVGCGTLGWINPAFCHRPNCTNLLFRKRVPLNQQVPTYQAQMAQLGLAGLRDKLLCTLSYFDRHAKQSTAQPFWVFGPQRQALPVAERWAHWAIECSFAFGKGGVFMPLFGQYLEKKNPPKKITYRRVVKKEKESDEGDLAVDLQNYQVAVRNVVNAQVPKDFALEVPEIRLFPENELVMALCSTENPCDRALLLPTIVSLVLKELYTRVLKACLPCLSNDVCREDDIKNNAAAQPERLVSWELVDQVVNGVVTEEGFGPLPLDLSHIVAQYLFMRPAQEILREVFSPEFENYYKSCLNQCVLINSELRKAYPHQVAHFEKEISRMAGIFSEDRLSKVRIRSFNVTRYSAVSCNECIEKKSVWGVDIPISFLAWKAPYIPYLHDVTCSKNPRKELGRSSALRNVPTNPCALLPHVMQACDIYTYLERKLLSKKHPEGSADRINALALNISQQWDDLLKHLCMYAQYVPRMAAYCRDPNKWVADETARLRRLGCLNPKFPPLPPVPPKPNANDNASAFAP